MLIYLSSSHLVTHKDVTSDLQWPRSLAILSISPQVFPVFLISVVRVLLQVSSGFPLCHFLFDGLGPF